LTYGGLAAGGGLAYNAWKKSPDTKGSLVQKIGERVGSGDWGTKSYKDIMSSAYLPDKSEGLLSGSRQLDTLSDDSMMKMYKQGGKSAFNDSETSVGSLPELHSSQMTPHYSTGTEKVLSNSIAGSISSNLSKKYSPDTKMSDVKDSDMRDAITSTAQTYGVDPNSALKSYDVIKDNGGSNTDALFGSVSTMTTQAKNKISPEQQAYLTIIITMLIF